MLLFHAWFLKWHISLIFKRLSLRTVTYLDGTWRLWEVGDQESPQDSHIPSSTHALYDPFSVSVGKRCEYDGLSFPWLVYIKSKGFSRYKDVTVF